MKFIRCFLYRINHVFFLGGKEYPIRLCVAPKEKERKPQMPQAVRFPEFGYFVTRKCAHLSSQIPIFKKCVPIVSDFVQCVTGINLHTAFMERISSFFPAILLS